ncbi:flap endonuclease-1 [Candidatus Woesearchaeota archaeon]|nr:flap endonuclease-1 [Candidatus Woesearchaeota archaeon]
MGVQITEILEGHKISIDELSGRILAVDAPNHLYQFLTTIRARDGSAFTDSHGNITSHLIGLFSRSANLMQKGLKLAYVFDGPAPHLKFRELEKRKALKQEAEKKYQEAVRQGDEQAARQLAGRFSRLTPEMIKEAKALMEGLGIPHVDSPSEAEAQASFMAARGDAFAVASQDADCFLFGAPRLIRNLSVTGRRKAAGKLAYSTISPELFSLEENLRRLKITREQLIALCMLVGTDYDSGGIRGYGPKKALELVRKSGTDFETAFTQVKWSDNFDVPWKDVFSLFKNAEVTGNYRLSWKTPDRERVINLLCNEHDFSPERVNSTLDTIGRATPQKGLGDFF